jgi:hypothetical protein
MEKVDFKKELKQLYNPSSKEVTIIDVPDMNFLMIDGEGAPAGQQYTHAVQALYPVAYAIKFAIKKARAVDYGVLPLEGLWWMDNMAEFSVERKDEWKWTSMIMQPNLVTEDDFKAALESVKKKNLPAIDKVRFECYHEGKAAQIMHLGPFSTEGSNVQKLHDAIKASGHQLRGKHHEIYLGDPRKTAPDKLKTVLRQPMK